MDRHDDDTPRHDPAQPDAPDLGEAVQLDSAENLEGAVGVDALDAGYVPPDRPFGLDDDGVTGAGDSHDERLARERPDDPEDAGADPSRSGRLVADGGGAAMEAGDAIDAAEVGIDGGAASAEEAAVHDVDEDTRVDGEPSVAADPRLADPEVERELERQQGRDPAKEVEQAREDAERDGALGALGDQALGDQTLGDQTLGNPVMDEPGGTRARREGVEPLR